MIIRVNVGGKLDIVCFDKTGTLTEEGLDVLGVQVVDPASHKFGDLLTHADEVLPLHTIGEAKLAQSVFNTMTTCHSLRLVDDELVGDPLDQKMFAFTGWNYSEGEQTQSRNQENNANGQESAMQSKFSPPIVRPPPGRSILIQGAVNNTDQVS